MNKGWRCACVIYIKYVCFRLARLSAMASVGNERNLKADVG